MKKLYCLLVVMVGILLISEITHGFEGRFSTGNDVSPNDWPILITTLSSGDYSFDIDRFTVVGGATGTGTFVDEFDDDIEPIGPTYFVPCPLSPNAESGGVLNLNSNDACDDGNGETFIDVNLNDNNFCILPGIGGRIEGKFSLLNGITPNTSFQIEFISSTSNGMSIQVWKSHTGKIFASVESEGDGTGVTDSITDITDDISGETDITLRIDASSQNEIKALVDIGSDGSFETLPGSGVMFDGAVYKGNFGASTTFCIDSDVIVNQDGSVDMSLENGCGEPVPIELKFWGKHLNNIYSLLNIGSDGSIVLPSEFQDNFNVYPPGSIPNGQNLELGLRIIDPVTGEQLCVDIELVP